MNFTTENSPVLHILALMNRDCRVEERDQTEEEWFNGVNPLLVLYKHSIWLPVNNRKIAETFNAWDNGFNESFERGFYTKLGVTFTDTAVIKDGQATTVFETASEYTDWSAFTDVAYPLLTEEQKAQLEQEFTNQYTLEYNGWLEKYGKLQTVVHVDTEDIIKNWFADTAVIEVYDAYGSAHIQTQAKLGGFYIFNDYGEDGVYPMEAAHLCTLSQNGILEAGRIVYDLKTRRFVLKGHQWAKFPPALSKYPVKEFTGKRAYWFHQKKKQILLRVSDEIWEALPAEHRGPKRLRKNLSGTRAVVHMQPVE